VRWVELIGQIAAAGVTAVAECGPGKVLAALTKRITPGLQGYAITDPQSLQQMIEAIK
jgi:[acyl-carrier-protein] S-malonyltransferase